MVARQDFSRFFVWCMRILTYLCSILIHLPMKRFSLFFCLTLVCTGFMYGAKGTVTTRIYVSDKGDDNGPATQRHPTGSIGRALQMASDLRRCGAKADTIVIELARGTWHLTKPIVIGETAGGKPIPIVVRGQGMGRTIVSGGRELRGFVRAGDLWQMDMSGEMLMGGDIPQLFVNGRRAVCARFPNDMDFMRTGRATQTVIDSIDYGGSGRRGLAALGVKMPAEAVGILALVQPSPSDMRISFLHAWDLTRRSVLSFSTEDSMLYVAVNPWSLFLP